MIFLSASAMMSRQLDMDLLYIVRCVGNTRFIVTI